MASTDNLKALTDHIKRFITLDPVEEGLLANYIQFRDIRNKEHLLVSGQICKANYFVVKGCFRRMVAGRTDLRMLNVDC